MESNRRRGQGRQLVYQDLQPSTEWMETIDNHVLRVHLPGFKTGDIRVQFDNQSWKMRVRGRRPLGQDMIARVDQEFDVPRDVDAEKIGARFEQGWLLVVLPKKTTQLEQESPQLAISHKDEKKEEEPVLPEEKPDQRKKEAPIPKERFKDDMIKERPLTKEDSKQLEKAKSRAEKTEAAAPPAPLSGDKPKEKTEAAAMSTEEKPKGDLIKERDLPKEGDDRKKDEEKKWEKVRSEEDKIEPAPIREETPKGDDDRKEEEDKKWEKVKSKEDKIEPASIREEKPKGDDDRKEKEDKRWEKAKSKEEKIEAASRKEGKPKSSCTKMDRVLGRNRQEGFTWRNIVEEVEGWLDNEVVDKLVESLSKNRKVIAAAAVGFCIGFCVSRRLRSSSS